MPVGTRLAAKIHSSTRVATQTLPAWANLCRAYGAGALHMERLRRCLLPQRRRGAENVKGFYTEATEEKRRTQRRQRQKRPPEKQKQAASKNSKTKITEPARRRRYLAQGLGLGLVRGAGGAALGVHLGLQRVVERGAAVGFCGAYLVGG